MTNRQIEQWTIRSIEDLYNKHEQTVCIIKQLNERLEFLENKLMRKEEKRELIIVINMTK